MDQPDLGLPMSMYLDLDSYADYIAAYKTYMVDTARVMVRELGTGVSDEQLALVGSFFLCNDVGLFQQKEYFRQQTRCSTLRGRLP